MPSSPVERAVLPSIVAVRRAAACTALLSSVLCAAPSAAQSLGPSPPGYREYVSLLGTPIGSLPPLATYTIAGLAQHSAELIARYGYIADMALPLAPETGGHNAHSLNSFGLTGLVPVGLGATVSLTAGLSNEQCTGCAGTRFIGAIDGDYRILSTGLYGTEDTRFTLAVAGQIGVGHPATGPTWTANVGFPLAFTIGSQTGTRFIPFITPGVALLTTNGTSTGDGVSAARLLVGGGVSLFNPKSPLGGSVGFQYIFVDKTQVQFGIGVHIGGR